MIKTREKNILLAMAFVLFIGLFCWTNVSNAGVTVTITYPADGDTFDSDEPIWFTGDGAIDDIALPDSHLTWISSLDGEIGTGRGFQRRLSMGHHRITLVGHGDNEYAATSIEIDVIEPPKPITTGSYAMYDLGRNILYIPYSAMAGVSYWVNMKVISFLPLRLQLTGLGENAYDPGTAYATYNLITNTLHVPDFRYQGASYWLDLHMVEAQGDRNYEFEVSGADLN